MLQKVMAILISAHELSKSFTSRPLFDGITFSIETGQRIGLIGPNGAGKSTLLKVLAGKIAPDGGRLSVQRGLRVGMLEQVPQFNENATIFSTVMEGSREPDDWEEITKAQVIMDKLDLTEEKGRPGDTEIKNLSGGWKKRVALARELVREPDLLLLDEPTNHLDVESILWLEEFLADSRMATLTITHDRAFLQRISNQIIELDRRHKDGLLRINGDYAAYLEARENLLSAQESQETKLRNTLRRETEWLRRGAQARQTKQTARIKAHGDLKSEVDDLEKRNLDAKVRLEFQSNERNPKKLIEAKGIQKSYGGRVIVPNLDLIIGPKSRIGLLGPNGCGKSTLIRMLVSGEAPDQGEVVHAEKLQVAYFEQNRESLDPSLSVYNTVCPMGDYVDFGETKVHARSYLTRFLFSYDQMEMPVGKLSGGEQSRLLIARLMLKRANVLVLDEPTNDLDMATLDVLQEVLKEFNGAVILVTHDRFFLDQVCNQILAFGHDRKGHKVIERFADLSQWETWHALQPEMPKVPSGKETTSELDAVTEAAKATVSGTAPKKKKLSFNEQRELDGMEEKIQKKEARLTELTESMSSLGGDPKKLRDLTKEMGALQSEIDKLYARWEELTS